MPTFGERVLKALIELGKDQAWLARTMGVPPSRVSEWVNGAKKPGLENVQDILKVLVNAGASAEYLMLARGPMRRVGESAAQIALEGIRTLARADAVAREAAELVRQYEEAKRQLPQEPVPQAED